MPQVTRWSYATMQELMKVGLLRVFGCGAISRGRRRRARPLRCPCIPVYLMPSRL